MIGIFADLFSLGSSSSFLSSSRLASIDDFGLAVLELAEVDVAVAAAPFLTRADFVLSMDRSRFSSEVISELKPASVGSSLLLDDFPLGVDFLGADSSTSSFSFFMFAVVAGAALMMVPVFCIQLIIVARCHPTMLI